MEIADPPEYPPLHPPLPQLQQRPLRPASIANLVDGSPERTLSNSSSNGSSKQTPSNAPSATSTPLRESTRDRRISAACAACKKRKSKCTGGPPPCKLCKLSGIECIINESLDGRRKLAAKRVQNELQRHKGILDALLEDLRSPDNVKSRHTLHLVRSGAPLSSLAAHLLQSNSSESPRPPTEGRTKVPIDLLIQAEEVMASQPSTVQPRRAGPTSGSPPGLYSDSSSSLPSHSIHRASTSSETPDIDRDASYHLVQTMLDCSETDAITLLHDLRRSPDLSIFLQQFRQPSPRRIDHMMTNGVS